MRTLSKYYEDVVLNPEPNGFCMLKPGFVQYKDEFEKQLKAKGWTIVNQCTKRFGRPEIEDFYSCHKDKPFYNKLCDYMITDDCECYSCYKNCKDPIGEMSKFKDKVRNEWGEDEMKNAMHSSDSKENVIRECKLVFNTVNEKKEEKQDVNLENTQMEIDEMKPNETNQMKKIDPDTVKSIIINSPQMGKTIAVVSEKDGVFTVKINEKHYVVDGKISGVVINIAKYFKEVMGAPKVELNKKDFEIKIHKES
jgi:nucleoside-diphosphate kinase